MDEWEFVEEDGNKFYVNKRLGNICELANGQFTALIPKVVSVGPFTTLEMAKKTMESETLNVKLSQCLDIFVDQLLEEAKKQ
jgi:hypothetical protein